MQPQQTGGQETGGTQLYPSYQGPPANTTVPQPAMPGIPGQPVPGVAPVQGPVQKPKRRHHWGMIVAIVLLSMLLFLTLLFGFWAYTHMQEYKTKTDDISARAVAIAVQQEDSKKDKDFTEKEKYPLKTYLGPETYGGINLQYPKTWAAYVSQADKSAIPINGYFHPNFVPAIDGDTKFALRLQVTNQSYDQEMKILEPKVKGNKVTVSPIVLKNVPGVSGSRVTGEVTTGQKDVLVLIPLRDKTIKIWTESPDFLNDFDNNILANLKFIP